MQILIQNTNFETVSSSIGKKHLLKKYGGTLEIPDIPGKVLADFAEFYEKDFRSKKPFSLSILEGLLYFSISFRTGFIRVQQKLNIGSLLGYL